MKIKNLLPIAGTILFLIITLSSCEQDSSIIGSEILGPEIPNGILDDSHTVIAYSQRFAPVQTNRLPAYQLGVYNSPIYGKSTISLLSQLTLEKNNPEFGENAVLDSAFVYLPYFSTATTVDSTTTYELDSIYGTSPINIDIFESDYYLRTYDPESGFQELQNYFSDQQATFDQFLGQQLGSVQEFKPNDRGYVFYKDTDDEKKLAPGLRVKLDSTFFQEKVIAMAGTEELRNSNNFKNYLRGLYFKVDAPTDNGSLFIFDVSKAYVTLYYSYEDDDNPEERKNDEFKLNFGGINVNTFQNQPLPQEVQNAVENPDTINGEPDLYLRGGEGILSVVELFGEDNDNNGVADELEMLRTKKWIVNEANLIFYVNKNRVPGGATEPERIIIYDLKNSNVLEDYLLDPTNGLEPAQAYSNHFGKLQRGSDGQGEYYKMKITSHISNLINKDSTNVPLGIVVSQNVKIRTTQKIGEPHPPKAEQVPSSAVVSPEGTILYGNAAPNSEKRLKLQIYYTEPK